MQYKRAGIVIFALVVLFLIANWYLGNHQPLHVVNQLPADATVTVPGHDPLVISPGERKLVKAPEGRYDINIQVEKNPPQPVRVDISNKWYERFFSNKLFILDVAAAAVIIWEETTYKENPQPNDPYNYRLYVGEPFITIDKVNYKFEPFPETIPLESGDSESRTRVDIFRAAPNIMAAILVDAKIAPQKILTYLEAHLGIIHEDESLLSTYLILSQTGNNLQRALDFLEKELHQRPVRVEWHRVYQSARQVAGQKDKLIPQYDALLQKEPGNSDLLYLRGRLEPDLKSAFAYYDRAIAANSKNSHPYFAKAFHLAGNGELAAARELCETAVRLNPNSPRMNQMFYQLRFALKEYDTLEKESMSILSKSPLDWQHFQRLLEIRTAKGDNPGAEKAVKNYQQAVKKETPQDQYQLKLKSRMQLAYVQGDFNALAKDAATMEDQSLRSENLQVVYLNLGMMEEAEQLPGMKETSNGYTCLLYWLGWLDMGNTRKAAPWLNQAVKKFQASSFDEKIIGELLENQKPVKNLVDQLANLTIDINSKRILYTAFARLYPSMRPQLLPLAEKLNHLYQFPYHFLKKIIDRMK
jgi:tetratricopeptide (TPR) repeat protein